MTYLGLQIGYIVVFAILIPALVIAIISLAIAIASEFDSTRWAIGSTISAIAGVIFVIGGIMFAIVAFPYNPHYWSLYSVQGNVTNIDTSVQSSGKSISNYYVITLSGHNEYFVTENPRILDLKGRNVDLVCHANYVYQGADNYDCNIRSIGATS